MHTLRQNQQKHVPLEYLLYTFSHPHHIHKHHPKNSIFLQNIKKGSIVLSKWENRLHFVRIRIRIPLSISTKGKKKKKFVLKPTTEVSMGYKLNHKLYVTLLKLNFHVSFRIFFYLFIILCVKYYMGKKLRWRNHSV